MGKNYISFFLFLCLCFAVVLNADIASANYYYDDNDPCPEGSYQVPLSKNKKFRSKEHAQLAREATGLIRGLTSVRTLLASHQSQEGIFMCFSGIILNRRRVGHHEIFGQYKTYHEADPDKVISLIPVFFNNSTVQGLHGIKNVDENNPHAFEEPHILADPRLVGYEYQELLANTEFSETMDFPDFSLESLREKIRKTIDPRIKNILTLSRPGDEDEDEDEKEVFDGRIFIMRIETGDREDTDSHYYLASWLKDLSKGEAFPPVGLHAMLVRYSFEEQTLSLHEFKNATESVRNPFINIPKSRHPVAPLIYAEAAN